VNRRSFITLVGGAAASWPLAAGAQQGGKRATIGLLGSGTAAAQSNWTAAFVQRLHDLGWSESRNLAIEYRWGEGRSERFAKFADELARLKVDVIVTHNTPPTLAAKQTTSAIPIVFATAGDPVGTGIVASLARPGGNVTGLSSQSPDAAGKRLEVLQEVVPGLRRLAVLTDVANPFTEREKGEVQRAARVLGVELAAIEIRRAEDIDSHSKGCSCMRRRFTSRRFRSFSQTALASIAWRLPRDCRRCTWCENMSKQEV
jgi:putative ABC transport system substrate-binding protein